MPRGEDDEEIAGQKHAERSNHRPGRTSDEVADERDGDDDGARGDHGDRHGVEELLLIEFSHPIRAGGGRMQQLLHV